MSKPPECSEKNSVYSGGYNIINCRPPMTKHVIEGLSFAAHVLMWGFNIQYTQIWSALGDTEVMGKPSIILLD